MRFLTLVKKELLHNLRDKRAMFLMIVFPILMIVILGAAFSASFNSSSVIGEVKVAYYITEDNPNYESFIDFTKTIKDSVNIQFSLTDNKDQAKEDVSNGVIDSFVDFNSDSNINMFTNNLRPYNANLVKTIIDSYINRADLIKTVSILKPDKVALVIPKGKYQPKFTEVSNVSAKPAPTSKDYYAVTMFTMIILYSTNIGAFSVIAENLRKTYSRVMVSNVSKLEYLMAKVVGSFTVTCFQVLLVYLFSRFMLNTNWGSSPQYILLISASLVFMAVSVGIGLTSGIKNPVIMATVLNMTIPVFVFFAGGYVPLSIFNSKAINMMANLSPLKWTNEAIFNLIYQNDLSLIGKTVGINLAVGLVFLMVPIILASKRKDVI